MATEYVTAYQVSKQFTDWPFALVGAIPLIVGLFIILGRIRLGWKKPHWFLPIFACGFGVLWLFTAGLSILSEDFRAFAAYQNGDYQLVEGIVTDFRPMPFEGHQDECFSVQEKRFCYSDYDVGPGFRNTASHGGPIRSGLQVRIAYLGGTILRLEIPRDQVLTPAQSAATLNSAQQAWQGKMQSDPTEQRMNIAFLFTMVCWTLWWNVQWRPVMRFWVRPPNRPWVQSLFRTFFALNFIGAVWQLVNQLNAHPLAKKDIEPTLGIAFIMCAVVARISGLVLWMAQRRDRNVVLTRS